jgi:hypothetical protein
MAIDRNLEGTRALGCVLTRTPAEGKWPPDTYRLSRTGAVSGATPAEAERRRDHGGHREGAGIVGVGSGEAAMDPGSAAPNPDAPHEPYAPARGGTVAGDDRIFEGEL